MYLVCISAGITIPIIICFIREVVTCIINDSINDEYNRLFKVKRKNNKAYQYMELVINKYNIVKQ